MVEQPTLLHHALHTHAVSQASCAASSARLSRASAVSRSRGSVSGDLKLYQYWRFENVVFSSWNPYMKCVFLFVFFVSHMILMGCNAHILETQQI